MRDRIFDLARKWNRITLDNPDMFRLSVVDAWKVTDDRPETVYDGRHWIVEEHYDRYRVSEFRPLIGEAEGINIPFNN